jgi:hypothetical protein
MVAIDMKLARSSYFSGPTFTSGVRYIPLHRHFCDVASTLTHRLTTGLGLSIALFVRFVTEYRCWYPHKPSQYRHQLVDI